MPAITSPDTGKSYLHGVGVDQPLKPTAKYKSCNIHKSISGNAENAENAESELTIKSRNRRIKLTNQYRSGHILSKPNYLAEGTVVINNLSLEDN